MNECLCFNNPFAILWLICILSMAGTIGAILEKQAKKIAKELNKIAKI